MPQPNHLTPSFPDFVVVPADHLRQMVSDAVTSAIQRMERQTPPPVADDKSLPNLITRHQAATLLNVSLSTVDNYIRDGLLSKKRVGVRSVRLERAAVVKLARTV